MSKWIWNSTNFTLSTDYKIGTTTGVSAIDRCKTVHALVNPLAKAKDFSKNSQEVLLEMIFQLGIKNCLKFKKFNKSLKNKLPYMAALEMLNSRWYDQTPKRVEKLIDLLLEYKNVKQRR